MAKTSEWEKEIEDYCERFDVPIDYLAATLSDPKVVPMIRGKAFEYSAVLALRNVLSADEWRVEKPLSNASAEHKDIDVKVTHIATGTLVRVECKLSTNFRSYPAREKLSIPAYSVIKVKCMRSRTLGAAKVEEIAPKLGVSVESLAAHADNYRQADFDVVLTSIGNAFYRTNEAGEYEFAPTKKEMEFLEKLNPGHRNHRVGAFGQLYLAKAADLIVGNANYPIECVRQKCKALGQSKNCGFIPNYPIIHFPENSIQPDNGWVSIQQCRALFETFLSQPKPPEATVIAAEQLADELPNHN